MWERRKGGHVLSLLGLLYGLRLATLPAPALSPPPPPVQLEARPTIIQLGLDRHALGLHRDAGGRSSALDGLGGAQLASGPPDGPSTGPSLRAYAPEEWVAHVSRRLHAEGRVVDTALWLARLPVRVNVSSGAVGLRFTVRAP